MPNRIFSRNPSPETQSPPFGLVAWLEQTKVLLPLKGVESRFHVCGELVNVEVDQIFHQNSAQAMDCLYTFPLPARSAVYRCEMHVNGRVIRAKVEEQTRAREMAREQRAAGRRTALVEVERDNLFTLSLGNVQPGDVVVIRLAYFQTLTRLADWTSLRIPFCPGVRYIPGQPLLRSLRGRGTEDDTDQVPDASRLSPPRIDALHADAAYLSVEGEVENGAELVTNLSSPSHPVLVRDGEKRFQIRLADQTAVPDCDFVLRWTDAPREDLTPIGWVVREDNAAFALVRLQAPRVATPTDDSGQDFYFLVDRSGSMQGLKWQKAVQAFRGFLNLLGLRDRAWVTFFNNSHRDFAERPLAAAEWAADGALAQIEALGADGGTELLPALQHALDATAKHSIGRRAALVLITDGEVGNETAIFGTLRPHTDLRVHTFGIDTTVNDALLTRVAEQQRGSCCLLMPTDDIAGAVTRLAMRLRRPVLTAITVEGGWELPGDAAADLHSEEVATLALKGPAGASEVCLKGRGHDGVERSYRIALAPRSEPALRLLWAKSHVDYCLRHDLRTKAIALARQYNVLCEGTAFIAWDEAEKVPVATRELYQPSLDPMDVHAYLGADVEHIIGTVGYMAGKEFGGCDTQMFGSLGPRREMPRYRRQSLYAVSPQLQAQRLLEPLVRSRPPTVQSAFRGGIATRLGNWYQRMIESYAFDGASSIMGFIQLLFEWVLESEPEMMKRLLALERLQEDLERHAPDLSSGLPIVRAWIDLILAATPEYHRRALDELARWERQLAPPPPAAP